MGHVQHDVTHATRAPHEWFLRVALTRAVPANLPDPTTSKVRQMKESPMPVVMPLEVVR
ncbi:hypothetical protein FB381_1860 [Nocardioides albertanoniae]|uniref:Uncharacterized protein n=1 Tax=Nocardioides albertanoniae TaxID=1175486 RepID=A0A543A5T9_9ACTN|nr:hypothetical protein FB381_1860 [Nocardioides albertanoniae]